MSVGLRIFRSTGTSPRGGVHHIARPFAIPPCYQIPDPTQSRLTAHTSHCTITTYINGCSPRAFRSSERTGTAEVPRRDLRREWKARVPSAATIVVISTRRAYHETPQTNAPFEPGTPPLGACRTKGPALESHSGPLSADIVGRATRGPARAVDVSRRHDGQ